METALLVMQVSVSSLIMISHSGLGKGGKNSHSGSSSFSSLNNVQSGDEDQRNIPPDPDATKKSGRRRTQLSPEIKQNYYAIAGMNILQCLGPVDTAKQQRHSEV